MDIVSEIFMRLFAHFPATIFSSLGLLLIAGATGLAFRAWRLSRGAIALGRIVDWKARRTDETLSYAPVFRFTAGSDGEFEVQSSTVFVTSRETGLNRSKYAMIRKILAEPT